MRDKTTITFCSTRNLYLLLLLVAMFISGCATPRMYEGEKLPNEQVAIIKQSNNVIPLLLLFMFSGTEINEVNNTRINREMFFRTSKVEVLPGLQKVAVIINKSVVGFTYWGDGTIYKDKKFVSLEFNAEAGHEYEIKAPFWWKKSSMVKVVDIPSGFVVASQPIIGLPKTYSPNPRLQGLLEEEKCMKDKGYGWVRTSKPIVDFIMWGGMGPNAIPSGYWYKDEITTEQLQKDYSECR